MFVTGSVQTGVEVDWRLLIHLLRKHLLETCSVPESMALWSLRERVENPRLALVWVKCGHVPAAPSLSWSAVALFRNEMAGSGSRAAVPLRALV